MTTTVETGVMQLQAKKHQSLSAAVRGSGEARRVLSSWSRGERGPADTLTSSLWIPEPGDHAFLSSLSPFLHWQSGEALAIFCSMGFSLGLSDVVLMIGSRLCTWGRKAREVMSRP